MQFPTKKYGIKSALQGKLLKDQRLVFIHMPKAAGTSVHDTLSNHFLPQEICPERYENIRLWLPSHLSEYKYFCVHSSIRDISHLLEAAHFITILRDPVERFISHYEYLSSFTDDAINRLNIHQARICKSLNIEQLFEDNNMSYFVNMWNPYAQYLVGDISFSNSGKLFSNVDEFCDLAVKNLEQMSFVGISERLTESMDLLARKFDIPNRFAAKELNISALNHTIDKNFEKPRAVSLNNSLLDKIMEITRIDSVLYSIAVKNLFGSTPQTKKLELNIADDAITFFSYDKSWVSLANRAGFAVFGPYIRVYPGQYIIELFIKNQEEVNAPEIVSQIGFIEICSGIGAIKHAEFKLERYQIGNNSNVKVVVKFDNKIVLENFEIRIFLEENSKLQIAREVNLLKYLDLSEFHAYEIDEATIYYGSEVL